MTIAIHPGQFGVNTDSLRNGEGRILKKGVELNASCDGERGPLQLVFRQVELLSKQIAVLAEQEIAGRILNAGGSQGQRPFGSCVCARSAVGKLYCAAQALARNAVRRN
jgi:hypothetical protein